MDNNKGQSSIEFLLTFIFAIGFLLIFVQLAVNAGMGYLTHYATFMASRSYLVYDTNAAEPTFYDDPTGVIRDIVNPIFEGNGLDTLGLDSENREVRVNIRGAGDNVLYEYLGVVTTIRRRFSFLPIVGGDQQMSFVSESFLGREPTRGQCLDRICNHVMKDHIGFSGGGLSCNENNNNFITVYDNGC